MKANVMVCSFQREKRGPWEKGFYINENTIVDANGQNPEEIYDVRSHPSLGCFIIEHEDGRIDKVTPVPLQELLEIEIARAKEYVRVNTPNNGSEPQESVCIVQGLLRLISRLGQEG